MKVLGHFLAWVTAYFKLRPRPAVIAAAQRGRPAAMDDRVAAAEQRLVERMAQARARVAQKRRCGDRQ